MLAPLLGPCRQLPNIQEKNPLGVENSIVYSSRVAAGMPFTSRYTIANQMRFSYCIHCFPLSILPNFLYSSIVSSPTLAAATGWKGINC